MIKEECHGMIVDGDKERSFRGLKIFKVEYGDSIYWFVAPSCLTPKEDLDYFVGEIEYIDDFMVLDSSVSSDSITEVSEEDAANIECEPADLKDVGSLEFSNVLDGAKKMFHQGIFAITRK
jgi:hypothetical protein